MSGHSDAIMLVLWFPSNHIVLEVIKSPPTSMLSINPPLFPNSTCCTLISNMAQASSSRHQFEDKFDRFKNLFGQHMTRLSLHHEEPTEPVYAISMTIAALKLRRSKGSKAALPFSSHQFKPRQRQTPTWSLRTTSPGYLHPVTTTSCTN